MFYYKSTNGKTYLKSNVELKGYVSITKEEYDTYMAPILESRKEAAEARKAAKGK